MLHTQVPSAACSVELSILEWRATSPRARSSSCHLSCPALGQCNRYCITMKKSHSQISGRKKGLDLAWKSGDGGAHWVPVTEALRHDIWQKSRMSKVGGWRTKVLWLTVMLIKNQVAMIYLRLQVPQHQQTVTRIPEVTPTQKQTRNSWLTCARALKDTVVQFKGP